MSVYTIVYRSVPVVIGSAADYLPEIDRILAIARRRNAMLMVTGTLFFNEDRFVQVLEGTKEAVSETFARIAADPRHDDVKVLFESCAAVRRFPEWSMAFVGDMEAIRKRFAVYPLTKAGVKTEDEKLVDFTAMLANELYRTW